MFKKLLIHDFKALTRSMLPLQLGTLVFGLINVVTRRYREQSRYASLSSTADPISGEGTQPILDSVLREVSFLTQALVLVSIAVTLVLIARYFYKSLSKEEGLSDPALAVSSREYFLSKLVAGAIWIIINLMVVGLILGAQQIFVSGKGIYDVGTIASIRYSAREFSTWNGGIFLFDFIVLHLAGVVFSVLQVGMSVLVGSLARIHKALAALGTYIVCSIVVVVSMTAWLYSTFYQVYLAEQSSQSYALQDFCLDMQPVMSGLIVLFVALALVYYLVSIRILRKRTNPLQK